MFFYDEFGYLTDAPRSDRCVDLAPPLAAEWPTGLVPNWTGHAWVYLRPQPAPTPALAVPAGSSRQLRLGLLRAGLLDRVEAAVGASSDPAWRIWWEYSTTFERAHPMVAAMTVTIGATAEQADAVWVEAARL